jgi:PAS domain S-box-containing protein
MDMQKDPVFDLFTFFEMTPDLVCIAGKDGYFKRINPSVIDKLGFTKEELFERPISSFIHPDDRELTAQKRKSLLKGNTLLNFQNRYVTKNGATIWLEWSSIYVPDKEIVFAIAKDITERKLIDKEVEEKYKKFKGLATHFKTSIEEDRKYLATELHEELAQLASAVKMDIDWVGAHVPNLSAIATERVQHAIILSELLINTIRRISFEISPNMLHDLGLNATLEWHCKEFSILNGIPCHFESDYDESVLTEEMKIDFFRICQESLSNVMYHAGASEVRIRIEDTGDRIMLTITDNGKGFYIDPEAQTPGLSTMRERATSINGELTVKSELGAGTSIRISLAK